MMQLLRKKDGFTLIELLIVILTGTIVTAAVTTILLLAMRINRKSLDTVERQSIMRIMQSVFEDMGSDGNYEFTTDAIKVKGSENDYVLSYDETNDQLVTGQSGILMENVTNFNLERTATPFDYVRGLYTFSIESQGENYISSVYGRTQDDSWFADDPMLDYESGRNLLVDIAASQIGSTGSTQEYKDISSGRDYNLWYLFPLPYENGQYEIQYPEGWSKETPWCSVFASWVIEQTAGYGPKFDEADTRIPYLKFRPRQAAVNYLWLETYAQSGADSLHIYGDGYNPQPGDLIFFTDKSEYANEDLTNLKNLGVIFPITTGEEGENIVDLEIARESRGLYIHNLHVVGVPTNVECFSVERSEGIFDERYNILKHLLGVKGDGLDHVGFVAKVEYKEVNGEQVPEYVYTIEGNVITDVAGGMATHSVMLRRYPVDNEENNGGYDIFGYATLNWNEAYK